MGQDCNRAKPGHRFFVEHVAGHGYVVFGPDGKIARAATPFRLQAEHDRAALQAGADKAAKRGPRPCMRCAQEFQSEGIHNRMCLRCRGMGEGEHPVRPAISARKFG